MKAEIDWDDRYQGHAAENRPWDLDPAVLSRFEKKILIPLPDEDARKAILDIHLTRRGFKSRIPPDQLAGMTRGYSGREIESFCKQVIYRMIRERNEGLPGVIDRGLDAVRSYRIKLRELSREDFDWAAQRIHPQTSPEEARRYADWGRAVDE